jgi:hypothetical protein
MTGSVGAMKRARVLTLADPACAAALKLIAAGHILLLGSFLVALYMAAVAVE